MTRNGGFKLIRGEFEYIKLRCRRDVTFWRCVKFLSNKCRGKATTRQIGLKQMVQLYGMHNH